MLGLQKRYKKVTAFVLTRSRQALRFHLALFRNRAQIVTTKVMFSNNFATRFMASLSFKPACLAAKYTKLMLVVF